MPSLNIKNNLQRKNTPHTLSICKELINTNLYVSLLNDTTFLDVESLEEIKYLFLKSEDREKYTINLLHRLNKIRSKVEIETIRYDYKQIRRLSFEIYSFIYNRIKCNDKKEIKISPQEILETLYSEKFQYYLPKITLPTGSKEVQIKKILCQRWWGKQLKKIITQQHELLKIGVGTVSKGNQHYSSNNAVNDYENSLKANAFVPILRHTNTAFLTDLKPVDQRRFFEYLAVSKGVEKRAKSKGLVSSLLTLTLPKKYHANPLNGNSEEWQGYSPSDSYKKLHDIANKFNKVLHKDGIYNNSNFYSIKAIEPHIDETPHLHILLFFLSADKIKIQKSIAFQFGDIIFKESSKAYNWVDIDESKSSPINYLSKHFIHSDKNKLTNNIRIASTKALWKMKSFSFTGLPKGAKTLWKEYRKLGFRSNVSKNELEEHLIDFSCSGDFEGFLITLEKATADGLIKIIYKSVESKYSEKNNSFSHIEYNIPNTSSIGIRIDISPIKQTKINISKDIPLKESSNKFKKEFFSYFIKLVKVATNISNKMSNKFFQTLTATLAEENRIKINKYRKYIFYQFKKIINYKLLIK